MPKGVYKRNIVHRSPSREKQAFTVRLEADTYLKLIEKARQERRTIGIQVELMLEEALAA